MVTTILDYNDGRVYIIHHTAEENVEELLTTKYNFLLTDIEYLTTETFQIESLN